MINPGHARENLWFLGWLVQGDLNNYLSLGAELFYGIPPDTDDELHFGFNIGSIINITEKHHILLSAGTDIIGPTGFYSYIAYQLTFEPEKRTGPAQTHLPAGRFSSGPL